jgi:hypothetical protein
MKAPTESTTTASRQNKSKGKKEMEMKIVLHYSFSEDINTNLSPSYLKTILWRCIFLRSLMSL